MSDLIPSCILKNRVCSVVQLNVQVISIEASAFDVKVTVPSGLLLIDFASFGTFNRVKHPIF